jgi:hypothetical protein
VNSIFQAKQGETIDAPVLLLEVEVRDGRKFHWSTERLTVDGTQYEPRVQRHNAHDLKLGGEESVDAVHRFSATVANTDGIISGIEESVGWKGAKAQLRLAFFNLKTGVRTSGFLTVFKGRANGPELLTEAIAKLSFHNRLSLTRVLLPDTRIQRRCPWRFPESLTERQKAAVELPVLQPVQRCGYSADVVGGVGNLDGSAAFTSCQYTVESCQQRGMYDKDGQGRNTRRFGGLQFLPPQVAVRTSGEKNSQLSAILDNEAKYNDLVPLIYGTNWLRPPIVMGRNDGNLTRMEVLLGFGPIGGVRRVIVNGVEIPQGRAGQNMTSTGWWNPVSDGARTGAFNLDFRDAAGNPVGDPHGSLATISIVVPNRVSDGSSQPKVSVLMDGMKLAQFDESGAPTQNSFSANPAWVVLDLLRRSGWAEEEIRLASFGKAAEYCQQAVSSFDGNGLPTQQERASCHLVIAKRKSAAELVRGIRIAAGLLLAYDEQGKLELRIERKLSEQQPTKPPTSNATQAIADGWPAYEFGDGADGLSDISLTSAGHSSFRLFTRPMAETANRLSADFVNANSEYQQDGVSLADFVDIEQTGQEIAAALPALGMGNIGQAIRALRLHLRKSVQGNLFVSFQTGARGIGLRPGDLITISYARHGFERQLFRVIALSPEENYRGMTITAQIHRDSWYDFGIGDWDGRAESQPDQERLLPRALSGVLAIAESGGTGDSRELSVSFVAPNRKVGSFAGVPTMALVPMVTPDGTPGHDAGKRLFYGITALDSSGNESGLSRIARADLPDTPGAYRVRLNGVRAPKDANGLRVYRGFSTHRLVKIADLPASASEFADDGLADGIVSPPDPNFDHVNLYWRWQMSPVVDVSAVTANSISALGLGLSVNAHVGELVAIVAGPGTGQERRILSNTSETISVEGNWTIVPTTSAKFAIVETSWRSGAKTEFSPAKISVPWRGAGWLQVQARAANVADKEAEPTISPVASFRLSAGPGYSGDGDVPSSPNFALSTRQDGQLEISNIGFSSLSNTEGIQTGLLKLWTIDELSAPTERFLLMPLSASTTTASFSMPVSVDEYVQIDGEVIKIAALQTPTQATIQRAQLSTDAEIHDENTTAFALQERSFTLGFTRGLWGSAAGGNWSHSINLPNLRVAAASLVVNNTVGASGAGWQSYTQTVDYGLRTMRGGQVTLQSSGYLSVAADAVPRLELDRDYVVRDVIARVSEAPIGTPIHLRLLVGNQDYDDLVIPAGSTQSNVVQGWNRAPLTAGSLLGIAILGVGNYALGNPGRDLTVTIRF